MACLTIGISVATIDGERPVEDLMPGDKVVTRDHGIQTITHIRRRVIDWAELSAKPHLQPMLVRKGAVGPDMPEKDVLVSPNMRILAPRDRTALYFDERQALVAAKHILDHRSVHMLTSMGTTYFHIECAKPEVILAEGMWVESFQIAASVGQVSGNAQRNELRELFPDAFEKPKLAGVVSGERTLQRYQDAALQN